MKRPPSRETKYRWIINWPSLVPLTVGTVILFFTFNQANQSVPYGSILINLLCIISGLASCYVKGYLVKKEYYIINRENLKDGFVKVTMSDDHTTEQWLEVNGQLDAAMAVNAPPYRFTTPPIVSEFPPGQLITSYSLATQQKIYGLVVKPIEQCDTIYIPLVKIIELQNQLSILGYPFELDRLKLLIERRMNYQLETYGIAAIPHLLVYHLDDSYYALVSSNEAWSYRRIKKLWSDYRTMIISAGIGLFFFFFSLWFIDNNLNGNSWKVALCYGVIAAVLCQIALVLRILSTFPAVLKDMIATTKGFFVNNRER